MGAVTIDFLPKSEINGAIADLIDSAVRDIGGNIGISLTPTEKLDVFGAIRSRAVVIGDNNFILSNDGTGTDFGLRVVTNGSLPVFRLSAKDAPSSGISIVSNGNMGLGTILPSEMLSVEAGAVQINRATLGPTQDHLIFDNDETGTTFAIRMDIGGGLPVLRFSNQASVSGGISIKSDGTIGIGTENPSEALDIVGNGVASGNLTATDVFATG